MVRVISEKLFSPPRSRHSSGETVDKELAARAVEVLSSLNSRRLELSDCESSSDSHWDSEVDVEGDGSEISAFKDHAGGDGKHGGTSDVLRKRKERRRERNKLSAQAYRVRRKEQTVKQQTVLKTLQDQNTRLKTSVQNLEDELQKVRHSLRQRGYLATFTLPTPSPTPSSKSCTDTAPGSPSTSSPAAGEKFASFSQLCEQAAMASDRHGQASGMDNDQSRQQQIAPVVDNFLFSKSLATPTSSGAINAPTPTPAFTFPSSPVIGARHNFGATPFMATPLPTISEKPDDHFGQHHQHHPYPKSQLQQQQHADLNANANTFALTNANTINANANVFGMYNNSNRMNNNNNLYQTVPVSRESGACGDMVAQRAPFKVCKA